MQLDSKISMRRRGGFLIMVALMIYVVFSASIAIMTVDKCGDDDAPKHWNLMPPEWECDPVVARH